MTKLVLLCWSGGSLIRSIPLGFSTQSPGYLGATAPDASTGSESLATSSRERILPWVQVVTVTILNSVPEPLPPCRSAVCLQIKGPGACPSEHGRLFTRELLSLSHVTTLRALHFSHLLTFVAVKFVLGAVTSTKPTQTSKTPTATATALGSVLVSGYSWIRAVETPNYHKYL